MPSPRLKSPTALDPSSISLAQTSRWPFLEIRRPGHAEGVLVHFEDLVVGQQIDGEVV